MLKKILFNFLYSKNYKLKIILFFIITFFVYLISEITSFYLFFVNIGNETEYHSNILTINSILSGFSLTNLGILISISSDQLIEKLKGTDILNKRNILISQSICFGAISIMSSLMFVLNFNVPMLQKITNILYDYLFVVELTSLLLSIIYFLLSIKKMIQLLTYLYVPKRPYTYDKIQRIRKQMKESVNFTDNKDDS